MKTLKLKQMDIYESKIMHKENYFRAKKGTIKISFYELDGDYFVEVSILFLYFKININNFIKSIKK